MKNSKILLCCLAGALAIGLTIAAAGFSKDIAGVDAATITNYSYSSDTPFFNDYFDSLSPNNEESIDPYFDALPECQNTTNFCSLGTASYENINGNTVYVDGFERNYGDSLKDPNYGQGMLIYQCIQYKVAHPEKDVSIDITSYRFSITASVCLKRDSKQFGYMRSLFDEEHDNHGFVRIAFMLIEAARMGIHVNAFFQLPSYAVRQYYNGKLQSRSEPTYYSYFANAMKTSCYSSYENNKKVSDFLNYKRCLWNVNDKGSTDMMHSKICAVSAFRDKDNVDHNTGLFFTSSNVDANNYIGCNGNGWAQSGIIVSDHPELYRVSHNYVSLELKYPNMNDSYAFREDVRTRNERQSMLIRSGRSDDIPTDEQIIYLGSESDKIFELVFSPFGGTPGSWDLIHNQIAKEMSLFSSGDADDYYEVIWGVATFASASVFGKTMIDVISETLHKYKNINNKLFLSLPDFGESYRFTDLQIGKDIGFKKFIIENAAVHYKDILLSYAKNGVRQYVSIISSCNFHDGAFWYQANQTITIRENDTTGSLFYNIMRTAESKNLL